MTKTPAILAILSVLFASACSGGSDATPAPPTTTPRVITATATPIGQITGEVPVIPKSYSAPPKMTIDVNKTYTATMHTTLGDIVIELKAKDAPITVNNFVFLARDKYYDGVTFHRIVPGFVIQGGDPKGDGTGGPGYQFADEPVKGEYVKGTLAMANAGPNTNGSQFFIVIDNLTGRLPKNYNLFGMVTTGIDVVDKIAAVPIAVNPSTGERSRPLQQVKINSIDIVES